jgi:hypothetical protein
MNLKNLIEVFGGRYLFGGTLIQFGPESFNEMYKQIYDAGMMIEREECAKLCEETDDGTPYNLAAECAKAIRARTDHNPNKEPNDNADA